MFEFLQLRYLLYPTKRMSLNSPKDGWRSELPIKVGSEFRLRCLLETEGDFDHFVRRFGFDEGRTYSGFLIVKHNEHRADMFLHVCETLYDDIIAASSIAKSSDFSIGINPQFDCDGKRFEGHSAYQIFEGFNVFAEASWSQ